MPAQPEQQPGEFAPAFAQLLQNLHPLATARSAVSASGVLSPEVSALWTQLSCDGWLSLWHADSRESLAPELLAFAEVAGRQALTLPFAFAAVLLPLLREQPELASFHWDLHAQHITVGRIHPGATGAPALVDFLGPDGSYFDVAISPQGCHLRRIKLNAADALPGLDACVPVAAVAADAIHVLAEARFALDAARFCALLKPYLVFEYGQMAGSALAALDLAIAYAGERRQFGRAIGEFQAVKHAIADAWIAVDNGRYALRALLAMPETDARLPSLIRQCDRLVADSCRRATRLAIQVHGGIGFAWEHDAHIHLKRTYKLAAQLRPLVQALA